MLSTINRNKSKLVIASLAAGFGVHLHTLAQAANDSGTLNINGQISSTTCVLNMGDTAATASGVKTLQLGSTAAPAPAGAAGATFGTAQSVVFTVTSANGTSCTFSGNTLWDIGLTPGTYQTVTAGGNVLLLSSGTSATGAAANVGVLLKGSFGTGVTTGANNLNLNLVNPPYGVMLSGSTSAPAALAAHSIAVTAQFARTSGTVAPTAGAFSATLPLTVWYK
jgi:type 1 fimbria pilin